MILDNKFLFFAIYLNNRLRNPKGSKDLVTAFTIRPKDGQGILWNVTNLDMKVLELSWLSTSSWATQLSSLSMLTLALTRFDEIATELTRFATEDCTEVCGRCLSMQGELPSHGSLQTEKKLWWGSNHNPDNWVKSEQKNLVRNKSKTNSTLAKHAMFSSISKLYHTCNTNHISAQFWQKICRNYESPIWFKNLHHTNLSIEFACNSKKSNEHEMMQILGWQDLQVWGRWFIGNLFVHNFMSTDCFKIPPRQELNITHSLSSTHMQI